MPPGAAEEPVSARYERPAGLGQLERADDTAAVVRMNAPRRLRVELTESGMRSFRAGLVVEPLPALACSRSRRRGQIELGQGRAEVEPCAADHEWTLALVEELVDRRVGERRVLPDRGEMRERPDPDQPLRVWRAVREDR